MPDTAPTAKRIEVPFAQLFASARSASSRVRSHRASAETGAEATGAGGGAVGAGRVWLGRVCAKVTTDATAADVRTIDRNCRERVNDMGES